MSTICIPQQGQMVNIWILYSHCDTGTYIEGAFTHKVQAEAAMRAYTQMDRNNSHHWLREITTVPHDNHC